jgi:hypothetical protein
MSKIRRKGLAYLQRSPVYNPSELVAVSKLFRPEESWTRKSTWWFDLPIQKIKNNERTNYCLLGQAKKGGFIVLKVPNEFFLKNFSKFETRYQNRIRLHIAAEGENQFVDERGTGRVSFSRFECKRLA